MPISSVLRPLHLSRTLYKSATFYAKQTQLLKSQMNVNTYNTTDYENKSNWTLGENKPNSNPIKPNFRKAQMNVNSLITKDYRKKDDFAVQKNKPNSNPISVKAKMNANSFSQKDYENETALRPQKNKPNQTQSQNRSQKTEVRRQSSVLCSRSSCHAACSLTRCCLFTNQPMFSIIADVKADVAQW